MMADEKIAIIGLGYVGLPLAVEFSKIENVIAFDTNGQRIDELKKGYDKTLEVSKEKLTSAKCIQYTSEVSDLSGATIFIVAVPTPIDDANKPDLIPLTQASQTVGRYISPGSIVIYESTVYPGCTEEVCVPILVEASGLVFNRDFYCGYSPERVNPGDKVNSLTKVTKIVSGSTPETAEKIEGLYNKIIDAGTYRASSLKVAEAAKVIENTQRDINIAFVNELSVMFARMGIDTVEVLEAAGSKWNFIPYRPGLVGGHCIGVDPYYLTYKSEQLGYLAQVVLAGRRINDNMARYVARNTLKLMLQREMDVSGCRIGILGVTFKENCPDVRNSQVVNMIAEFKEWGVSVAVSDPWVDSDELRGEFGIELEAIGEADQVDVLVVAVGHAEYRSLSIDSLMSYCSGPTPILIDVKSLYDRHEAEAAGFTVFRL